jgi:iron complex outermembrane receptor protein
MFRGFLVDLSNTPNNASGFKETIDINDLYGDTHIILPTFSNVRVVGGVDALFAAGEGKGAVFDYTAPLSGATRPTVTEPSTLDRDSEDERRFLGAYTAAEWRPTDRFILSGGVRMNSTSEKRGEGEEVEHARVSGSLGAVVGLWESGAGHVRAFASYRNTFKPAAFDFGLEENEGVLDPETSHSFEGGLKVRSVDGLIDLEASAFQMDFENLVTSTVINNQPALINSGKTRFKGIEVASDVRLPRSLFARATYSFHDSKFVDFVEAFDGVPTQLAGNRFEMSAKQLVSGGLVLSPALGFIGNVAINYTGDRYLNKRNTALAGAFSTIDAGIGYRTSRAEFRLDARNLGDRRDPVAESEFGDSQYYRMPARTIRTTVVVRY